MISGIADDPKVKEVNADGSVDLYFGPEAPEGKEKNWIKTISGKGCSSSSAFTARLILGSTTRGIGVTS